MKTATERRYGKSHREIDAENHRKVQYLLQKRGIPSGGLSSFDALMTLAKAVATEIKEKRKC